MRKEFITPAGEKRKRLRRNYEIDNGSVKPIFEYSDKDDGHFLSDMEYTTENRSEAEIRTLANTVSEYVETAESNSLIKQVNGGNIQIQDVDTMEDIQIIESSDKIFEDIKIMDNESQIDPDTGQIISEKKDQTFLDGFSEDSIDNHNKNNYICHGGSSSLPDRSKGLFEVQDQSLEIENINIIDLKESSSPANTESDIFKCESSNEHGSANVVKSCTDEHIMHYIHKKFKKRCDIKVPVNLERDYLSIQNVEVIPKEENRTNSFELSIVAKSPVPQHQNRFVYW